MSTPIHGSKYVGSIPEVYHAKNIISHDGSMVLLCMVTWIPSIYPLYVSIYIYQHHGSYGYDYGDELTMVTMAMVLLWLLLLWLGDYITVWGLLWYYYGITMVLL